MGNYYVRELMADGFDRQGMVVKASEVIEAKHKASPLQIDDDSTLYIETRNGDCLAYKRQGQWFDAPFI